MIDETHALRLLKDLTEAHGAPGAEDDVRLLFRRELATCGTFSTDRLGSIVCEHTGAAPGLRVMITAHMDEVGFMVQNITDRGFVQLVPLGGWWTHTLLAQRVRIKTRANGEVLGVISSTPPHFLPEGDRSKVLPIEQLFVDVGARSREEAEKDMGLSLGDFVVPDSPFTPLPKHGRLLGKAFDNRAGLGVVIEAFRLLTSLPIHSGSLLAVATVQEELGCRGAQTATALARPDIAFVLEGTPADDTPGGPPGAQQGVLGGGPQIRLMDPTAIMSRPLVDIVRTVAERNNIPHQLAVRRSGGTDAKSIQLHATGVPTVVIGVPARYIHSHQSMIQLSDYLATIRLIVAIAADLTGDRNAVIANFPMLP